MTTVLPMTTLGHMTHLVTMTTEINVDPERGSMTVENTQPLGLLFVRTFEIINL